METSRRWGTRATSAPPCRARRSRPTPRECRVDLAQRRIDHAVAGKVVARVPEVVPDQKAVVGKQIRPKCLRGEVGAPGARDQICGRQDHCDEHGRRTTLWVWPCSERLT